MAGKKDSEALSDDALDDVCGGMTSGGVAGSALGGAFGGQRLQDPDAFDVPNADNETSSKP